FQRGLIAAIGIDPSEKEHVGKIAQIDRLAGEVADNAVQQVERDPKVLFLPRENKEKVLRRPLGIAISPKCRVADGRLLARLRLARRRGKLVYQTAALHVLGRIKQQPR